MIGCSSPTEPLHVDGISIVTSWRRGAGGVGCLLSGLLASATMASTGGRAETAGGFAAISGLG